mmetsp:Transcript_36229/g.55650  ORF Transcript_36229/g.55650 Transcript_36229/m.55650 type:complete len:264 (-) Transcript_36229:886-1677(-)
MYTRRGPELWFTYKRNHRLHKNTSLSPLWPKPSRRLSRRCPLWTSWFLVLRSTWVHASRVHKIHLAHGSHSWIKSLLLHVSSRHQPTLLGDCFQLSLLCLNKLCLQLRLREGGHTAGCCCKCLRLFLRHEHVDVSCIICPLNVVHCTEYRGSIVSIRSICSHHSTWMHGNIWSLRCKQRIHSVVTQRVTQVVSKLGWLALEFLVLLHSYCCHLSLVLLLMLEQKLSFALLLLFLQLQLTKTEQVHIVGRTNIPKSRLHVHPLL